MLVTTAIFTCLARFCTKQTQSICSTNKLRNKARSHSQSDKNSQLRHQQFRGLYTSATGPVSQRLQKSPFQQIVKRQQENEGKCPHFRTMLSEDAAHTSTIHFGCQVSERLNPIKYGTSHVSSSETQAALLAAKNLCPCKFNPFYARSLSDSFSCPKQNGLNPIHTWVKFLSLIPENCSTTADALVNFHSREACAILATESQNLSRSSCCEENTWQVWTRPRPTGKRTYIRY